MKPTLLVLAAGMGSRYGGLKQMDGLGPNGETIIDYSIYDAVQAGFGKVVYIVREYLFSKDEHPYSILKESNLYLQSESNYNEVKDKIKNLRPELINPNIIEVNLDKKFDNIWLSNIACYLQRSELKKATDKFSDNLNDDGQLLISYLYSNCMYTSHSLKSNLRLLKEYSPSFYSFKGVGGIKYDDTDIKDTVLIYQKKK